MRKQQKELYNILKENESLTPFERRVYMAVSSIPFGKVRSYKWVAVRAGRPAACRAVGRALNKNPYMGTVPCHRVIRRDGLLGGFSGGIKAKRKLLKSEGLVFHLRSGKRLTQ